MSWNLLWTPNETNKLTGEFVVLLDDEPFLSKKMYGQITNRSECFYLTFVKNLHKFSFEDFNEFINDFENGRQAKCSFDVWNGEDAFAYDETNEQLNIELSSYTSNLRITIPMIEKTRMQFAKKFRKFLTYYLELLDSPSSSAHR